MQLQLDRLGVLLCLFTVACGPGATGAPCSSTNDCSGGLICSAKVCTRQVLLNGIPQATETPTQASAAPDPDFALNVGALPALAPNGLGSLSFSVTRGPGFTAPLTVSLDGLPSGFSSSPVSLAAGQSEGSLPVTTSGASCATNTATVSATGGGKTHQASVTMTVTGSSGFTLTPSTSLVTMLRGTGTSFSVALARDPCATGAASLVVENLPANVTSSVSMSGDTAFVTVSAAAGAVVGASSFSVKASIGSVTQSASVSLSVSSTITGRVVGSALGPVRARVEIVGGACVVTEADGSFSLSSATLVAPYALRISELGLGETCATNKQATIAYLGLSSMSPTLTYLGAFGTGWSTANLQVDDLAASCSAATHTAPAAGETLAVMHELPQGLDWSFSYDSVGQQWRDPAGNNQASPNVAWLGTTSPVSGAVHMLRYTVNADGLPQTYSGYKKLAPAAVTAGGSTCFDSWDLALEPIAARATPATVIRTAPAGLPPALFLAFINLDSGGRFGLSNPASLSTPRTSFLLPDVPASLGLREFYGGIGSKFSYVARPRLAPSGDVAVAYMSPPTLTAHGAAGVCGGNSYCWDNQANALNVVTVSAGACQCSVVTTQASVDLVPGMCATGCAPPTAWSVTRFSPFASMEAATTSAGFSAEAAGLFGGLYGLVFLLGPPKTSIDVSSDTMSLP